MLALLVAYPLALAQAASAAPEAAFDLRHVEPATKTAETIMVTGRRRSNQRLPLLPILTDTFLPRAQVRLFGNGQLGSEVEADTGGMPSIRLTLSIPF